MSKLKGKNILLIDDDRLPTKYYIMALEQSGCNVHYSSDNDSALEILKGERNFDLIIQDVMRPPGRCLSRIETREGLQSGLTFYKEYIQTLAPTVPVVFLTNTRNLDIVNVISNFPNCTICQKMEVPPFELVKIVEAIVNESKEELYRKLGSEENSQIILVDYDFVNQELLEYLAKHPEYMYYLNPRKFEELVARIFIDLNYDVTLTPETRDGGKDIYAIKRDGVTDNLFLIECKKYSRNQKVGVEHVRSLYGIKQAERATSAILVTTSFFTKPAKEFQSKIRYELNLRDYNDLKEWLRRYK